MRKIEIIPAVMPRSASEIESAVLKLSDDIETLQIDIMDGKYTRDSTWPFDDGDSTLSLDIFKNFKIELDLMVRDPLRAVDDLQQMPIKRVIVHRGALANIETLNEICKKLSEKYEVGVAITINDSVDDLYQYDDCVDTMQVMGIPFVGVQSMPFDARSVTLIEKVADVLPTCHINVDGGMKPQTAKQVVRAGATRIVSGSFLLSEDSDFKENLQNLRDAVSAIL
jgi:ribulose-phosphate 3-epimerase